MNDSQLTLLIDGQWLGAGQGESGAVLDPSTGKEIDRVPFADAEQIDRALAAAQRAFSSWRCTSAYDRAVLLRKAGNLLRERADRIARRISLEQGKPIAESMWEVLATADIFDWTGEEGRRAYGSVIPPRQGHVDQIVVKEPIGPAAAFSPWNGPAFMFGRKVAEALAAGCTCIIKPAEETPGGSLEVARAFVDAGLPPGVLNVLFGVPAEISTRLISSPIVRKVSFTGSVEVGRQLARLAGDHLKRITLELGGHAPVVILDDVDVDSVAEQSVAAKFANAGQICASPTRFLVHESIYEHFVAGFSKRAAALRLGAGLDPQTQMGPLANARRLTAMERIIADARAKGAVVETGGERRGATGFFFEPTVLSNVSQDCEIMNREPFGPIAAVTPFRDLDAALEESNRLPYALAGYVFCRSREAMDTVSSRLDCGVVGVNTYAINVPETPFGGRKDSGLGSEGGADGVSSYLISKYIARAAH
ncbi:MAG: NAD-dependent succinate-semialdehyde dehydrogenase [Steroidobacteraceae bacterium]|jgi:succinate-semialdehyde dehydrogenase/glutarate-semialdehyde dehydrogenase|nr:NAD-dependent succinate-semialdehyde dehydrogenase [Steroidobacteraceae bacterium]